MTTMPAPSGSSDEGKGRVSAQVRGKIAPAASSTHPERCEHRQPLGKSTVSLRRLHCTALHMRGSGRTQAVAEVARVQRKHDEAQQAQDHHLQMQLNVRQREWGALTTKQERERRLCCLEPLGVTTQPLAPAADRVSRPYSVQHASHRAGGRTGSTVLSRW